MFLKADIDLTQLNPNWKQSPQNPNPNRIEKETTNPEQFQKKFKKIKN